MKNIKRHLAYLSLSALGVVLFGMALSSPPAQAFEHTAAPLSGATLWINSAPLALQDLRGQVVLVDFWTYGCSNCLNALPHVKDWAAKYTRQGLVVVGVHTPETASEKIPANVENAVRRLGIVFPVALDNQYLIWNAYGNQYWPAQYLIDAQGNVRYQHVGEGDYLETEHMIQSLLREAKTGASPR